MDNKDRRGFIRKVYGILSVQLLLTGLVIAAVQWDRDLNAFMREQGPIAMGLIVLSIAIECAILCCKSVSRKVPTNYILLFVFTACQAFIFGVITSFYTATSVISASGMTAGMTLAITVYACTTKTDFTTCSGLFLCLSIGMLMLCCISFFFTFSAWWHPVLSAVLVVFYGLFLIYDTQLIAGGGQHALSYDDYIVGALIIYIDIMMIFLELLKLFGSTN